MAFCRTKQEDWKTPPSLSSTEVSGESSSWQDSGNLPSLNPLDILKSKVSIMTGKTLDDCNDDSAGVRGSFLGIPMTAMREDLRRNEQSGTTSIWKPAQWNTHTALDEINKSMTFESFDFMNGMSLIQTADTPSMTTVDVGVPQSDSSSPSKKRKRSQHEENTSKEFEGQKPEDQTMQGLLPTPIGSTGIYVVNSVPLDRDLFSTYDDRKYIASLMKQLDGSGSDCDLMKSTDSSSLTTREDNDVDIDVDVTDLGEGEGESKASENKSYQNEQWNERYMELMEYRSQYGHCNVPYHWPDNKPLSQWVKRQRHQHKLKKESKHSNLTDDRELLLERLGFVWDSRASNWEERYHQLRAYKVQNGHCQVGRKTKEDRQLAVWLKRQRHLSRQYLAGDTDAGITPDRIGRLVDLGVAMNFDSGKIDV